MIRSFRDRDTERLFARQPASRLPSTILRVAQRKLAMLDAANQLADLRVPPGNHLEQLAGNRAGQYGKRSVSADTALRLARYFSLSDQFWMNLQARYDLEVEKDRLAHRLESEVKILASRPA